MENDHQQPEKDNQQSENDDQPSEGYDSGYFKGKCALARNAVFDVIKFAPVFAYFWIYWPKEEFFRKWLRRGSYLFTFLSVVILAIEIILHLIGANPLARWLLQDGISIYSKIFLVLTVVIIALHNASEFLHGKEEDILVNTMWTLLESRGETENVKQFIGRALPLVRDAFSNFSFERVCLWFPDDTNSGLRVSPDCMFPYDKHASMVFLENGRGIANHVYKYNLIEYVPRFGFPFNSGKRASYFSSSFRHAFAFATREKPNTLPTTANFKVLINAVQLEENWWDHSVRSFVAVPLKTRFATMGVLCIDFGRTNAIGRDQMKVAASLAIVIAEEINRILFTSRRIGEIVK